MKAWVWFGVTLVAFAWVTVLCVLGRPKQSELVLNAPESASVHANGTLYVDGKRTNFVCAETPQ